jgi:polyisoprenoid-binding protein YceI
MRSRTALLSVVAVLLLAIGGAAIAYTLFLKGDDVAPLALPSQEPGAAAPTTGDASSDPATSAADPGTSTSESPQPTASASIDAASLPGTWTVAADSVAGYRVRERLANLSADSDAVGRTDQITGSATIASSGGTLSVTDATFTVDMTTLRSDRAMRDNRLRNDGIQTDQFPTSTFKLTQAVTLPAGATTGAVVDVTLHGDLTLHGVTKSVDIPAEAQLNGSQIQVLGSLSFPFSDFQIDAPNIGGFVSVQDNGTLEFQVNLARS